MTKVPPNELRAIRHVLYHAKTFGYGNLSGHILAAWADSMISEGLDPATAIDFVSGRSPMPILMHLDIVNNGEWDETGKKYFP